MRHALIAVFAAALLMPEGAQAAGLASSALADLALGQISFEGLDLDKPAKKGGKKKKPAKGKKKHEEAPAAPVAPEKKEEKKDERPPAPAPTPTAPAPTPPALGVDLTKPEAPKPAEPPKKEKAAPTMTFGAMEVSGKSAERQRLDAAIRQFKDDNYDTAALAFNEVLKDPAMADLHDEAGYMLAKALYRMKMYHASLGRFRKILEKGPTHRLFKTSLEWLFFISHKMVNESVVLDEVARWANQEFPDKFRSEFRYLLSRYHFVRGKALDEAGQADEAKKSFAEAKRLALMVSRGDPFYGKVKYLEATVHFKEGNFAPALEAYKEVVRANNPRTNPRADADLRELAFMQLARTHYGHKQNRYAIYYYDRVARGSDQWLEALFEASWAHFRIGNYERALGNLITLSSPFFKDEYFPEALILKAVIYYENCRYREARAILEEFEQVYMPVHNELEKITAQSQDAQRYYDILAEIQKRNAEGGKGTTIVLERILKLALTDKDLKQVNESILEVEKEMDSVGERKDLFRYSDLSKATVDDLKKVRQQMIAKAGILAKAKLEIELVALKELLGNALRIKFETSTKEKEFLEETLLSGGQAEILKKYKYSVAVSDERLFWPYEGEFWRDELGSYEYTLTKGCKAEKKR